MKKQLIVGILILSFGLVSCNGNSTPDQNEEVNQEEIESLEKENAKIEDEVNEIDNSIEELDSLLNEL